MVAQTIDIARLYRRKYLLFRRAVATRRAGPANHANQARQVLEQGDVEQALNAAAQIGDDTLQRKSRGTIQPESFTHGTSEQRVRWFKRGIETGSMQQCNTFDTRQL